MCTLAGLIREHLPIEANRPREKVTLTRMRGRENGLFITTEGRVALRDMFCLLRVIPLSRTSRLKRFVDRGMIAPGSPHAG